MVEVIAEVEGEISKVIIDVKFKDNDVVNMIWKLSNII